MVDDFLSFKISIRIWFVSYIASWYFSFFCHSSYALYQLLFHIHGRCHR